MKKSGLVWLLLSIAIISGCAKSSHEDQITSSQLNAVQKMKSSFQNAKLYNDSLASYLMKTLDNSEEDSYYDHMFHFYEYQFDSCHNLYEHNSASADHSHNGGGMVEMHSQNGMMNNGQCCSNGGHSADMHQRMIALRELHYSIVRGRIVCSPNQ